MKLEAEVHKVEVDVEVIVFLRVRCVLLVEGERIVKVGLIEVELLVIVGGISEEVRDGDAGFVMEDILELKEEEGKEKQSC